MDRTKEVLLKSHWTSYLTAEHFGNVRPNQVRAMNYHLASHLKGFDEEYEKVGGKLYCKFR